jgi:hypothetical protein
VLRRVPVGDEKLGGLWLGVGIGLALDPRAQL